MVWVALVAGCAPTEEEVRSPQEESSKQTARLSITAPPRLNVMAEDDEDCDPYQQEELREPVEILPVDGVLETQLVVAMKRRCVPVYSSATGWKNEPLSLRTYGYPIDHSKRLTGDSVQNLASVDLNWSAPGPTFVLNKATAPDLNNGTNFKMVLFNRLEPEEDPHRCNEIKIAASASDDGTVQTFTPQTTPNCFHGDNSTNFHFHGFHVSPQPHQDWVGLELLPFGASAPEHAVHTRGEVAVGEYPFDVDRLRYTQAEGTHWYHAHKHGSTALQVLNGLVGTFKILGEFDTQLEELFEDQGGLRDRLMVVQQLQEKPPGYIDGSPRPTIPLINGMANPIVKMRPGEVQRWRFVGATMQASASLDIGFPQGEDPEDDPQVRQIAMDGVQFAPQNYACQPFLNGPDCKPGTDDDSYKALGALGLDPGTRIDLLIKAPSKAGRHVLTFKMTAPLDGDVMAELQSKFSALVREANEQRSTEAEEEVTDPPLLTLVVEGEPVQSQFPTEDAFPRLPEYLDDLKGPFKTRTVAYEMNDQRGNFEKVEFFICGTKYDPSCVNQTIVLNEPEEWTLTNNNDRIRHPFHIHTNPFQLIRDDKGTYPEPYVWRDTVPIPTLTDGKLGEAVMRYEAKDFTGEFVNHCHILGHEDRGMMHGVQTICANDQWGKPTSDLSPECREGNYLPAAPECPPDACGSSRAASAAP